ncbi:hypothetical protein KY285_037357 [Solanum tuberosum]|nr:hypothetical protein KY285_037357 [Solanum tuberosum]
MPLGTAIHNIEITLGKGGQLARASGCCSETDCKRGEIGHIKITFWGGPFDIQKLLSNSRTSGECWVNQKSLGRAGSKRWLGKRPVVRGVVMNPVDHPHGGGEGRAPIGRKKPHNPLGLSCTWKKK